MAAASSPPPGDDTFAYVYLPADASRGVRELRRHRQGFPGDALPEFLSAHFATSGGSVSPDAALAAAAARLGADAASRVTADAILRAVSGGKTETFALMHPSNANGHRGVYAYCDEVGKLKSLPTNDRARELAERCGLDVSHPFHGDVFIGAVRTEPTFANVDFTEGELDANAEWIRRAPAENAAYAEAMRAFRDAVREKRVDDSARDAILTERGFKGGTTGSTASVETGPG